MGKLLAIRAKLGVMLQSDRLLSPLSYWSIVRPGANQRAPQMNGGGSAGWLRSERQVASISVSRANRFSTLEEAAAREETMERRSFLKAGLVGGAAAATVAAPAVVRAQETFRWRM